MKRPRIAWTKFGKDLKTARESYGQTVRGFSDLFGIDKSTVSRAERGRPIAAEWFVFLSDWMGRDSRDYLAPLYTRKR